MSLQRPIRAESVIRPRLLPYAAGAAILALPAVTLVTFRRDLIVEIGEPAWLVAASIACAVLAAIAFRLLKPVPLMTIRPEGIRLPRLLNNVIRWVDIKRVESTRRRNRIGDVQDRLVIHLRQPTVLDWRPGKLRRTLGGMPQAALAVEIGLRWPCRADALKETVRGAARNFATSPRPISDVASSPPRRDNWVKAPMIVLAASIPIAMHLLDLGLARQFSTGIKLFQAGQVTDALPYLETDARAGDPVAAHALGTLYLNGDGVKRNPAMAAGWFQRAAKAGHADAAYHLGEAYRLGFGVPADLANAVRWLERASDGGSAVAAFTLGRLYRLGDGVRRDYGAAIRWLRTAAARDFAPAEHDLGRLYHDGIAVPRDLAVAADWYARAAKRGHVAAYYDLARLLIDSGTGRASGIAHLRTAAEAGFAPAQRRLAQMLFHGQGLPVDPPEAYKWVALAERNWPARTRADLVRERARIEAALTPEQIARGKDLLRAWRPKRP